MFQLESAFHYIADFGCQEVKLVVEIDGATHSNEQKVASDKRRMQFLEEPGFNVIRFTNETVFESVVYSKPRWRPEELA